MNLSIPEDENPRNCEARFTISSCALKLGQLGSVEGAATSLGAAEAGNLVLLDGELVVVGDFLARVDLLLGEDDNLLLPVHLDHLQGKRGRLSSMDQSKSMKTRELTLA